MLITLCLLLGLQTEILLSVSPGHLLFSENRFSLCQRVNITRRALHFYC